MTQAKEKGRWPEFSDATGIDRAYEQARAEAERQLKEATAGPGPSPIAGPVPSSIPPGDTAMKNPEGAFADPAPGREN